MAQLKLGTRGSPLALAQTRELRDRLMAAHTELREEGAIEISIITTSGDKIQDRPLGAIGGKGLFTKEIEEALYASEIDMAVHSMKDMPTRLPEGLEIPCLLPREDRRDVLIRHGEMGPETIGIADLPQGAMLGTASLRRGAGLLHRRPDLKTCLFRGNVGTRLEKLRKGEAYATLLAAAGLKRLGYMALLTRPLCPQTELLPAVGQGAIGIEIRSDDKTARQYLEALNCPITTQELAAERAFLAMLDGSCRTPIAASAESDGVTLSLQGQVFAPDGRQSFTGQREGSVADAAALGQDLGREIKAQLPAGFFSHEAE